MTKYRPDIDGLRAIAVLSVVGFHAFPALLPGGFIGVDVFFVISGYIITTLLRDEWQFAGAIDITAFYARRVRRIFPALVLVVVATVAAAVLLLRDESAIAAVARSAAASLLFAGNWYFQTNTGGYFDPSSDLLPLLHLWSLGVEEQFYLLWPLAMAFVLRRRPRALFGGLSVVAGISFSLAAVLSVTNPTAAFYLMPTRFWELAVGGLLALSSRGSATTEPRLASAGLALILGACVVDPNQFQVLSVLPAVLGAGMLLRAVHSDAPLGPVSSFLRSRPAIFFGHISFSLYLWHWPLLALARSMMPGDVGTLPLAAICATSVLLGWASFRFVETPLRRPIPGARNGRLVFSGVLTTGVLAYFSVVVAQEIPPPATPPNPLIAATGHDYPANRVGCHYNFKQTFENFPPAGCAHNPSATGAGRVVIWGDSRAYAWQPLAWALADQMGVPAVNYTRDSCPPALGYDNSRMPVEAGRCREFNTLAFEHLQRADTVILAAAWPSDVKERDFDQRFAETMAQLAPKVRRVVLLGPTPLLRDTVPRCIASNNLDACAISRAEFSAQSAEVGQHLARVAARFKNVEYVDPTSFFCGPEQCPAMKDGYGLYWDAHHISSSAARAFAAAYLTP